MFKYQSVVLFLLLFSGFPLCAQEDTASYYGTIKISKPKNDEIYIKASVKFVCDLNNLNTKTLITQNMIFQPEPIVDGYLLPFDYTNYFTENFKNKSINLRGLKTDTVFIELKVLSNGKVFFRDKSPSIMLNGVPAFYNKSMEAYELNNLHLDCIKLTDKLRTWNLAYVLMPKKQKFKKQTIIKPKKEIVSAKGLMIIAFSTVPFEE